MQFLKHPVDRIEKYVTGELVEGWTPAEIPDMNGKVALVTGGNSGLGYETARKLAENGAHVWLVSRDMRNGQEAAQNLRQQVGKRARVDVLECDMQSLKNVVDLVQEFTRQSNKLDILVNMAGVFHPGPFTKTKDGIEQTLAINYYAHALLTLGLLDTLRNSPGSRVIMMSSPAETYGRLDWKNLTGEHYSDSGMMPYGTSKVYLMMLAKELSVRVPEVDFLCVHPGLVLTPLQHKTSWRYITGIIVNAAASLVGQTPYRGAYSTLYAATNAKLTGTHWGYYGPNSLNLWPTFPREPFTKAIKNPVSCWKLFEDTLLVLKSRGCGSVMQHVPKHPDDVWGTSPSGSGNTTARKVAEAVKQVL